MTDLPMPGQDEAGGRLEDTLALCLSGGGYRAMLFHTGVLWYLNDAGLLPEIDRISSVSGGSLTAGVLAMQWKRLEDSFDAGGRSPQFGNLVVVPIRRMAGTNVDTGAIVTGALLPGVTIGDRVIAAYRRVLFGDLTLQALPDRPRFFISATNLQTGSLFRFSKTYLADYRIGRVFNPRIGLAEAVAASSAFPPLLSPARLELQQRDWGELAEGPDARPVPPFTTNLLLSDAGVYDNLGIEPVWKRCKRVLVSDGGGRYEPDPNPPTDAVRQSMRVMSTTDNQVRSLRKRQVVGAFIDPTDDHSGAYLGMRVDPDKYPVRAPNLVITREAANELAHVRTRLAKLPVETQNRLINFGYGMAERAVRSHYKPDAFVPERFPAPNGV